MQFLSEKLMEYTHQEFQKIFRDSIELIRKQSAPEMMGWFELEYEYKPKNFRLVFETQMRAFDIMVFDNEDAFVSLGQLCPDQNDYDSNKKSISEAIASLHTILQSKDLVFYISNGKKTFEKRNGKTKRIK